MLNIVLREPNSQDFLSSLSNRTEDLKNDIKISSSELKDNDLQKLLKRTSVIENEKLEEKQFFRRDKSIPAPKTGEIVESLFPPKEKTAKSEELILEEEAIKKELKILRFMPEGNDIETVPQVIVTFNQPMIPLTSVDNLKGKPAPIEIEPKTEGEFRWIGTKTIQWKPKHRMPKSTKYNVKVPKGIKSEYDCKLKEEFTFSFQTSNLKIKKSFPHLPVDEKGIFFIKFNQKVKKEKILENCLFSYLSNEKVEIEIISSKEAGEIISEGGTMEKKRISLFNGYKRCLKENSENSIWFKAKELLKKNQAFKFVVKKGSNFGEGDNPTLIDQETRHFETYKAMDVRDVYPRNGMFETIVPRQRWSIYFTNNIELNDFNEKMIKIEPEIEGVKIDASRNHLSIQGNTKGRTTYKVTLNTKIKDVYGQNLLKETTKQFKVGSANPFLQGFYNNQVITIDPTEDQDPSFSIVTMNLDQVRFVVLQVEIAEFHQSPFGQDYYKQGIKYNEKNIQKKMNCGRIVFDKNIRIKGEKDSIIETKVNLTPYLQFPKKKLGQLIVYCEIYNPIWKFWRRTNGGKIMTWIQCTNLAVQTHCVLNREVIAHLSSLKDGSSVANGKFSVIPCTNKKSVLNDYKERTISGTFNANGIAIIDTKEVKFSSHNIIAAQKDDDSCFVNEITFFTKPNDRFLTHIIDDRGLYKPKEEVSVKIFVRKLVFKGNITRQKLIEFPKEGKKINFEVFDARGAKIHSGEFELDKNGSHFLKFKIKDDANLGDARINFKSNSFHASHTFKIQEFRTPEFTCSVNTETPGPHVINSSSIVKSMCEYYSGGFLSDAEIKYSVSQSSCSFKPPSWGFRDSGYWKFQSDFMPISKQGELTNILASIPSKFKGISNGSGKHELCVDFKLNPAAIKISPTSINVDCDFQDINRQTIHASTNFIVHPSNLYLGLKLGKRFARVNDTLPLDVIVTDLNGIAKERIKVEIKIIKRISCKEKYKSIQKDIELETIKLVSTKDPVSYNIKLKEGGNYHIVGTIFDENGYKNNASQSIWVSGGEELNKSKRIVEEKIKMIANAKSYKIGETCKILIESPLFSSKDEGTKTEGFYFVYSDSGIEEKQAIVLEKGETSAVLNIDIKNTNFIPNFKVEVELTGVKKRIDESGRINKDSKIRPAYASGSLLIEVPPKEKEIDIEINNKKIMAPGDYGQVEVKLKGKNVEKSKVSLVIVDEAVLALSGYEISNPLHSFFKSGYFPHEKRHLRSTIHVKDWNSLQISAPITGCQKKCDGGYRFGGSKSCCFFKKRYCCRGDCSRCCDCAGCIHTIGVDQTCSCISERFSLGCERAPGGGSAPIENQKPIAVRSNFNPLACFINDQETNEKGEVSIKFKLPDNLTRYRVWVIATNGSDNFGLNESFIKAQLPISIRPSVPRFFNYGDKAYCSIVLQNQTLEEIEVFVACKVNEKLKFAKDVPKGFRCLIPFNKRAELRFLIETKNVGIGKIQFVASSTKGNFSDAAEKEIPIYQPATTEAFATYGEIDEDGKAILQKILPPTDAFEDFGGLQLSISSTNLQSLTDAFLYLCNYEFDCVEQICSRMLSVFLLQDVLFAFNVPNLPKIKALEKMVKEGQKKIKANQRSNGAIGFWTILSNVNVYLSIHVTHCLIRGVEQKYEIDQTILSRGKSFCMNVEKHVDSFWNNYYTKATKASLIAFACYVLTQFAIQEKLSEDEKLKVLKKCNNLWEKFQDDLNFEGKLWLMFTLFHVSPEKENNKIIKVILEELQNKINETPKTANIITRYGDKSAAKLVMLHSNRRTDAICLEVLIHVDPSNYLIPKFVKGLLAGKKKGNFGSTQENVYVLIALKEYFNKYEKITPNFFARIWLGEKYAGEMKFKGRETKTELLNIPMKYLLEEQEKGEKEKRLCLVKNGNGRLYYRLGLDYAPKNTKLKPIDYGFKVERTYEGVTDKSHARYDKEKDCWIFKAGELIRSKLKMVNNSRRYHVALVDYLPAGCEVLNPELKGTSKEAEKHKNTNQGNSRRWWSWYYSPWYCHHNLRDERIEAFATNLFCGEHEFSYIMRATSFGTFIAPPTKAEEMYSPEIFGRTKTEIIEIQ